MAAKNEKQQLLWAGQQPIYKKKVTGSKSMHDNILSTYVDIMYYKVKCPLYWCWFVCFDYLSKTF